MSFLLVLSHRPRMPSRAFLQGMAVFFLVCSLLATGSYGVYAWYQVANGVETTAVVLDRDERALTVEFTTEDGVAVRTDIRPYAPTTGDTVVVRYLPQDPGRAQQAEEPPVKPVYFALGGFFVLLSLGMLVYAWRCAPASAGRRAAVGGQNVP